MNFFKNLKGQALVEYAVLLYFILTLEAFLIGGLIAVLDEYVKGIYFVLQSPFP